LDGCDEVCYWQQRVGELEEKVEQLRLSRRVLLNLVEKLEKERVCSLTRLEKENIKLHLANNRYARSLVKKYSDCRDGIKKTGRMKFPIFF